MLSVYNRAETRQPGWVESMEDGFTIKQRTNECCRCCCCQPNIDWVVGKYNRDVSPHEEPEALLYIEEDAPYLGRCCSYCIPGGRPTTYYVHRGSTKDDPVVLKHQKEWTCGQNMLVGISDNGPVRCPCCCFLPYLDTIDPETNTKLGTSRYLCDLCLFIPKFGIYDAHGNPQYLLRPNTCCCGCCIRCKCCEKGARCCQVPYYFRDYHTKENVEPDDDEVSVRDLWAGIASEACTRKNLYTVKYPSSCKDAATKAVVQGAVLLLEMTMVEQNS